MRDWPLPRWGIEEASRSAWVLAVALVGAVALFGFWGLAIDASDSPVSESPDAVPSTPGSPAGGRREFPPTAVSRTPDPSLLAEVQATTRLTHSLFLPFIFRDYWQAPNSLLGIQLYFGWTKPETVAKVTQMGGRWARLPISWASVEPANTTPEQYQWPDSMDGSLARLSAANIQIILTLTDNPSWAATYPGGPIDQVEIDELAEFMAAAVAHYSMPPYNVKHWELYNEPDNGSELFAEDGWGYWGYYPDAYAEMLAAVYQPMKSADAEARIVFGGLAYDWWTRDGGPFVEEFLDGVLQNGGGDFFDVMNFHYYPAFRAQWKPYGKGIIGKATYLRNKLAAYGVDKPLICTEASMWSDEAHGGSHELQSRYVVQLYARSVAADLKTAIWFFLVDSDTLGSWKRGLLNSDFSPKPAYFAYWTLARQLAGADYVQTLSSAETGSDQIEAYEFLAPDRSTRIIVAWTEDDQEHQVPTSTKQVVVVDKFGHQTTVYDDDDGVIDGRVRVTVGPSPVYLRFAP